MDTRANRLQQPHGLPDMLLYRLNRLRAIGGGMVLRHCEGRFGVTRREWVMLALLSDGQPMESSKLAARAELNRSATSKAITAMVRKGLLQRVPRLGDRRFAEVTLSAQGRATYEQILPVVADINRRFMSDLDETEIAQLDDMLDRMQRRAEQVWQQASELPRADRRRGGSRRAPAAPTAAD